MIISTETSIFNIVDRLKGTSKIVGKEQFEVLKGVLTSDPYNIRISEDTLENAKGEKQNLFLLKYDQIRSDFSYKFVRQCRGIIFDRDTFECVCYPFDKFFNWGEDRAVEIDWASASILEKVDGSLIKVWYSQKLEKWIISTNGTIDAYKAKLSDFAGFRTFADLVETALRSSEYESRREFFEGLDLLSLRTYTLMFEVVSPINKVVVAYPTSKLYYLSSRSLINSQEYNHADTFRRELRIDSPKRFSLVTSSLEEVVKLAKNLPFNAEGYVVVDKYFNRIKVKSPSYVAAHHLKNNGMVTIVRLIDLIKTNETDEFLNYFPEYQEALRNVQHAIRQMVAFIHDGFTFWKKEIEQKTYENERDRRRAYAMAFTKLAHPAYFFALLDGKMDCSIKAIQSYVLDTPSDKLSDILKKNYNLEELEIFSTGKNDE